MKSPKKINNAFERVERQCVSLPFAKVKIFNKANRLSCFCLLNESESDSFAELFRKVISKLCEANGLRYLFQEPAQTDVGGDLDVKDARQGMSPEALPSCQVSVEEKIQLFSFLRKG